MFASNQILGFVDVCLDDIAKTVAPCQHDRVSTKKSRLQGRHFPCDNSQREWSEESSYDDDNTIDDESVDYESVDDEGTAVAVAQNPVCSRILPQPGRFELQQQVLWQISSGQGELECHRHVCTSDASVTPMFTGSTASSSDDDDISIWGRSNNPR